MSERLIYRPNCFSAEQWEALSREAQVAWWQEEIKKPGAAKVAKGYSHYKINDFADQQIAQILLFEFAAQDLREGYYAIPETVLSAICKKIEHLPAVADEEKWSSMGFACSSDIHTDPEETERRLKARTDSVRGAVRVFREMYKPRSGGIQ